MMYESVPIINGKLLTKVNPLYSKENYRDNGFYFVASDSIISKMAGLYLWTGGLEETPDYNGRIGVRFRPRNNKLKDGTVILTREALLLDSGMENYPPRSVVMSSPSVEDFVEKVDRIIPSNESYILIEAVPSKTINSRFPKP